MKQKQEDRCIGKIVISIFFIFFSVFFCFRNKIQFFLDEKDEAQ
jgi:hypothetical protein